MAGDWGHALNGRFDAILVNPPYIPMGDVARLEPEVRDWDPRLALTAGADGLDAYRSLAANWPQLIEQKVVIAMELGAGQDQAAAAIFADAGLEILGRPQDLSGVIRCLLMRSTKPT